MRIVTLVAVSLCVAALALAAPQLATDEQVLSGAFGDADADESYGPVEESYFRVASYDRYTGTGWERTAGPESTDALTGPPGAAEHVTLRVAVQEPVRTLPAPWRPTAYDGPDAGSVDGSLEPLDALSPGDEYTVTSTRPVWIDGQLREAGEDYPDPVADRYTQLPDEEAEDLEALATDVTAGAETPYERAVAVERWLQTEKGYALDVDRPDGDIATSFANDVEAGHCQYFATTMVALLRAEGVPARYVSGYSPYEQVGGEHVVRGMYAHAWVEVYFPDVGWVPFDPTPAADREEARGLASAQLQTGGAAAPASLGAATAARDGSWDVSGPVGVAGARDTDDGGVQAPDQTGVQAPNDADVQVLENAGVARSTSVQDDDEWGELEVAVDGDVVPGAEVTVRATDPAAGDPVEGAQVRFDGSAVGETDEDGEVVVSIPYAESVTVSAHEWTGDGDPPPVVDGDVVAGEGPRADSVQDLRYASPSTEISGSIEGLSDAVLFTATVEEGAVVRRGTPRPDDYEHASVASATERYSLSSDAGARTSSEAGAKTTAQPREQTFDLETEITVWADPDEDLRPGDEIRVLASIDGEPVPEATVRAGEETATTDDEGSATVPAPFERTAEIVVERGDAEGNTSVSVDGDLAVDAEGPRSAGEMWTVTATLDGDPVPGATVSNGVESEPTGEDGEARIPVPYASDGFEFVAERGDFEARYVDEAGVATDGATVEVGDAVPGGGTDVAAVIDGVPVRNAAVTVDGQPVGETDHLGRASVALPYRESVTVGVARGDAGAETTVDLPTDVAIDVEGLAVPGGDVVVRATVADGPVENATVYADGDPVATTGVDGRAALEVPLLATALDVQVEREAATGERRAGHLWTYWLAAVGIVSAAATTARRRGLLAALRRDPRTLLDVPRSVLAGIVEALRADLAETLAVRDAAAEPESAGGSSAGGSSAGEVAAFRSAEATDNEVYRAWAALAAGLEGTRRTPSAVEARALEVGLPAEPVEELTALFRAVRYGDAEATDERERRARRALERIREAAS